MDSYETIPKSYIRHPECTHGFIRSPYDQYGSSTNHTWSITVIHGTCLHAYTASYDLTRPLYTCVHSSCTIIRSRTQRKTQLTTATLNCQIHQSTCGILHSRMVIVFFNYSKNLLNRTSTGPDKMSGLERIPVYRGFSYLPIIVGKSTLQLYFTLNSSFYSFRGDTRCMLCVLFVI